MAITVTKMHLWPSARRGNKLQKAQKHAMAIIASCNAVEQLVAALAVGRLPAPNVSGVARKDIRYAPYFSVGRGASERNSVPYTAKWIERTLITDGKTSRWIRVALQLLSGRERGYVDQNVLDSIANLRPGYDATAIAKRLRLKEKEFETLHGAEIALGILQ